MTTRIDAPAVHPSGFTEEQLESLKEAYKLATESAELIRQVIQWGPKTIRTGSIVWRLVDGAGLVSEVCRQVGVPNIDRAHGPDDPTGRGFYVGDAAAKA